MCIYDALSGKPLQVLEQCVPITVIAKEGAPPLPEVHDAKALSTLLLALHAERCEGGQVDAPAGVLLTAGPAAGKTSLMSQVIMHALASAELVPILIKVQRLQRFLLSHTDAFAAAWNWLDAHLKLEHAEQPEVYRMLRQALMARRALVGSSGSVLQVGGSLWI